MDNDVRFPKNLVDKKQKHGFVDEWAMITTTLISSCHWKTLVHFCLQNKRPDNAFLKVTVNCRKNHTKKHFMPSKITINWLFNDIWCYLVIACFD